MTTAATVTCSVNFSTGAGFGETLILGSTTTPLGYGVLGTSATIIADLTAQVLQVAIRRQYSRTTDTFNPGTATVILADTTGDLNPDNPSGAYYGKLQPMRKITLTGTYAGITYGLFRGYIQSYTYTPANGADVAKMTFGCVDGMSLLNLATISTVTGAAAGDTTGERIELLLDAAGWPVSMRKIDSGETTCQADPGTVRQALAACQTIEETEFGAFYADFDGNMAFNDRNTLVKASGTAPTVFTDDELTVPGILYQGVSFAFDDVLITNQATVTAEGLTPQTFTDPTSVNTYFLHSDNRTGLLMETEADAYSQAKAIVTARANAEIRVDGINLDISNNDSPARIIAALDCDYLSNIRVVRTAPGGALDKTLLIQGVNHDITPNRWVTQFQTVDAVLTGFILGSAYSGILGTDVFSY